MRLNHYHFAALVLLVVAVIAGQSASARFGAPPAASAPGLAASDNATITGAWTFGTSTITRLTASTTLTIPFGAAPVVTASGTLAIDTTDDQLLLTGAATRVIPYDEIKCATILNASSTDDNVPIFTFPDAATLNSSVCKVVGYTGGTVPTISIKDDAGNAITGQPTCGNSTSTTSFTAATAGNTFTAGEGLQVDVTNSPSPSSSVAMQVCWKYTIDRQ